MSIRNTTFIVMLLSAITALAQPLCEVKQYSVQDGLNHRIINDILQDHNGLIWIGTWNGLTKFNGYDFKYYKSYPGDGCTMRNTRIDKISENCLGNIWCHTQDNRAYLFDVKTESFIDVLQKTEEQLHQTNHVIQIYTLKKGITWIVCSNGHHFRIDDEMFLTNKNIELYGAYEKKLKGDTVYSVSQDFQNDEWILTDKGVSILGKKKMKGDLPFHLFVEKDQQIWLGNNTGILAKYIPSKSNVQFVDLPTQVNKIHIMKALKGSYIGMGTNAGLILLNTKNAMSELISIPGSTGIELLYEDKMNDLWLFDSKPGVLYMDRGSKKTIRLQSPFRAQNNSESPFTQLVYEDAQGNVWVVPRGGDFCYFNRIEKKLTYLFTNPEEPSTIVSPPIRTYFTDYQGNLWFGTNNSFGKISFSKRNFNITNFGEKSIECRALLKDSRTNFWVASKNGKIRIYDKNEKLIGYLSANGSIQKKDCTFGDNAYCLMEDHLGNIWIGTKQDGLFWLKRSGKDGFFKVRHFIHNPSDEYSISNNSIYTLVEDRNHRIWVGSFGGGLNLIEWMDENTIRFLNAGNRLKNFPISHGSRVRHIIEGTNGVLLIGTNDGLITFSSSFNRPEEIKFYWNTRKAWDKTSLSNNDVMYLFENRKKRIYAATQSGGLNELVSKDLLSENLVFKIYNEQNGLPSDLTRSIIEDKEGHLWISSQSSLARFNPEKALFENYDSYSFKQPILFSEGAVAQNANGEIVFGTANGLLVFNPQKLVRDRFVPSIIFTELKLQGKHKILIENSANPSIKLKASQRNFSIQFAALDYRDVSNIRYAYFLKGIDTEWHFADLDRVANYMNLPHGHFQFLVKSTNSDGDWVNNEKGLNIDIAPTFWETGWAWLFYSILFIGLIVLVGYILFTFYRLKHEVDLEQQLSEIKLRFFTDVSHELRTPLTLISSPISEILENENLTPIGKEHLQIVQNNTNRMLRLVNQILDFRKIQNNKMKVLVEEVDVVVFIARIMDNFQLLVQEKNINFQLESDFENFNLWIDKDKFEKILFNLLSNAFKYTPSGKSITVKFNVDKNQAFIAVKDEGIGINETKIGMLFQRFETLTNMSFLQNSTGLGLSLAKELVELHHGSIEVHSQPTMGSEFKVSFKTGNNHFKEDKHVEFLLSNSMMNPAPSLYPTEEMDESNLAKSNSVEDNQDRKTILIVEDNIELSRFLRNILLTEYEVLEARNGEEGLQEAIRTIPDMIISDIMMPKMDGLDMVHSIKENNDICHIPIILLSAKDSLDDRINGLESGIDDYITKPFSATFLKKRIQILLKQRRLMQVAFMESLTTNRIDLLPSEPLITSYDEILIKKIMDFMELNINNAELTVDDFVKELNISRTIVYRKMKTLLGLAPVDLICDFRLKRSIQYLESGIYSISEISYMCGFNDPNYFTKVFKRKMGVTPKAYKPKKNSD